MVAEIESNAGNLLPNVILLVTKTNFNKKKTTEVENKIARNADFVKK